MGAAAQAPPLHHAAGQGQHVLHRAAGLRAHQVVGQVGAEAGRGQSVGDAFAQRRIGAGQGHRAGQAARDLRRKARAGQHRQSRVRQHLGGHLGHQFQRALLHPLGAQHHGRAGPGVRRQGGQGRAHVLGRTDRQQQLGAGEVGRRRGGAHGVAEAHAGQVGGVLPSRHDGLRHLGLVGPHDGVQTGARAHLRQRRAPGPRADHAHRLHGSPISPTSWGSTPEGREGVGRRSRAESGNAAASALHAAPPTPSGPPPHRRWGG